MSGGFPHSDIHGSKPVPGSPWLNAGYHVLHRLLLPRHPPNALFALDLIQKEHDRAGSSQSSFQCQKLYTFPCNDPKIVAVSVLDLNNIALMRHASGHPSLGRPAILMLYLSKRCQILLPVVLSGDMGVSVRLDDQTHPQMSLMI